jgi:hypothetical protein
MRALLIFRHLYERFFGYGVFISYFRAHTTSYAVSLQRQLGDCSLREAIHGNGSHPDRNG